MKTKYIKVPVSERLPEEEKEFLTRKGELYFSIERKQFETYKNTRNSNPGLWLEEVPDHSEEMISLLQQFIYEFEQGENSFNTVLDTKELLNKVKL